MSDEQTVPAMDLKKFDVSYGRGFLPKSDPVMRLINLMESDYPRMISHLPKLLAAGRLSHFVGTLEEWDDEFLREVLSESEHSVWAMKRDVDFIVHGYVYENPKQRRDFIPANLARSLYRIAKILGVPPLQSYSTYALHNWYRIDPDGPIELGNIALIRNFWGGLDEEWFILPHVVIEAEAGPALAHIPIAQSEIVDAMPNPTAVLNALETIYKAQEKMLATLGRIPENCDPYIYYHRVRPFIHGWERNPMIYEGVEEYGGQPQRFFGETGAQSSIVPTLDAFLGIQHEQNELTRYLDGMLGYMPPKHRAFIAAVSAGPSVREYVLRSRSVAPGLAESYNHCVRSLYEFRALHLQYAQDYIFGQNEKSAHNPNKVGTGGTPMEYLGKHRDETLTHLIPQSP